MMQGVHFRVALWVTSDPRSDVIVVVGGVVGGQAEQRRQSVAVPAAVHAVHPTGGQFAASLLGRRAARRPRSHEQTLPGNAGISAEVNPPPTPHHHHHHHHHASLIDLIVSLRQPTATTTTTTTTKHVITNARSPATVSPLSLSISASSSSICLGLVFCYSGCFLFVVASLQLKPWPSFFGAPCVCECVCVCVCVCVCSGQLVVARRTLSSGALNSASPPAPQAPAPSKSSFVFRVAIASLSSTNSSLPFVFCRALFFLRACVRARARVCVCVLMGNGFVDTCSRVGGGRHSFFLLSLLFRRRHFADVARPTAPRRSH